MLKKTISFIDYNGVKQTEELYFHLNKAEFFDLEFGTSEGFIEKVEKAIDAKNYSEIYKVFKEIVLLCYGQKADDNKHFYKSEELRKEFEQSEAFGELLTELCSNADAASAFVNGILPAGIESKVN